MGKGRVETFPRKLIENVYREKIVHNRTKIDLLFLTLNIDNASDVYLINQCKMDVFLNILKSTNPPSKHPNKKI